MFILPRHPGVTWQWLLAFMPLSAFATPVTLPQALVAAQDYSAELSASRHQINALDNRADSAMQLPDPKLKFGIENLPVSGGNTDRFSREGMTMERIGIMQDYVSSNKRQRKADTLRAESRQITATSQSIRARLQRDAALAWMELAIGEQNVSQIQQLVDESSRQIGVSRGSVSSGSSLPASVLDARLTLISMQDKLTQAERDVQLARTRLSQLTGIDQPEINGAIPDVVSLPVQASRSGSVEQHPEIIQARREAEVAQAKSSQSAIAALPDVGVEVYYAHRADRYEDLAGVMFTVDLPLFTASRQDKDHAADQSMALESNDRLAQLVRDHQAQLTSLLAQYQAASTLWQRQKNDVIPLQRQRISVIQAQYRAGKSSLNDVLEARRTLLDSQLAERNAELEVARSWVALRYLAPQENQ
ncbi:TolC family protein [Rahnella bonaserana]|jgi:outer membrane protein TolC|uniref:TolC family protein n=1 Tax=Rahnella bonaserana TaxID=2816248 RepID=A0ABS6LV34_9GAMM|nr:TolC family protein [Rahnella bonaserana]MBU9855958.1 TolC family protein [Rahnella bonaserana]MCL9641325.1 TolC family protein [Rahnella victoriana]WHZ38831.1 TolC family protein [Rahnella bonaserana]